VFGLKNYYMDEEGMTAAQAEIALEDDIDAFAAKPVNGWTNWKEILFKNGSHQNYEISLYVRVCTGFAPFVKGKLELNVPSSL